jgi:hypothetical protein
MPAPSASAVSTSRTPATPSSTTEHASTNGSSAPVTRSTISPGESAQRTAVLRSVCAKLSAAWTVDSDVSSPSTTSTSRAPGNQWKPTTFSGRSVIPLISVIEHADPAVASTAPPGVRASSQANTSCLAPSSSSPASITKSTSPSPS